MDLQEIIRLHKLYLENDSEGVRANLSWANLSGANLSWANLSEATLVDADLRETNVVNTKFPDGFKIIRLDFVGLWPVTILENATTIGCQSHPNSKWLEWTPDSSEIKNMEARASQFWEKYGSIIKECIRASIV